MKVTSITKRFGVKFAGKLDPEGVGPGLIVSFDFVTELATDTGGCDKKTAELVASETEVAVRDMVETDIREAVKQDPRFALLVRLSQEAVDKVHQRDKARSQPQTPPSPVRRVYQGFSREARQPVFRKPTTVRRGK